MGVGQNDLVWRVGSDVEDFSLGINRAATDLGHFETATKGDFSSGLVRELQKIEQQAKILRGEMTAAEIQSAKFARAGASGEMIQRYKVAVNQVELARRAEEEAAQQAASSAKAASDAAVRASQYERDSRIAFTQQWKDAEADAIADVRRMRQEEAAADAARRSANINHNRQQETLISQFREGQQRRDDANVSRQMDMYRQAQTVKLSLLSNEERYQRELIRLQDLKNRGLITENQLTAAAANTRSTIMTRRGPGGSVPLGFIAQQGAIGLQDAVTGYQMNGIAGGIMAGGNNVIQMLSLMNPMAGTVGALTVAATQLAVAFGKGKDAATEFKTQMDAVRQASEVWGNIGPGQNSAGQGLVENQGSLERMRKATEERLKPFQSAQYELDMLKMGIEQGYEIQTADLEKQMNSLQEKASDPMRKSLETLLADTQTKLDANKIALDLTAGDRAEAEEDARAEAHHRHVQEIHAAGMRSDEERRALEKKFHEEQTAIKDREDQIRATKRQSELAAAKAVTDALRTPQQALEAEAINLWSMVNKGDITESQMAQTLARMNKGAHTPALAQNMVRGTLEEVRWRNQLGAQTVEQKAIDATVALTMEIVKNEKATRDHAAMLERQAKEEVYGG